MRTGRLVDWSPVLSHAAYLLAGALSGVIWDKAGGLAPSLTLGSCTAALLRVRKPAPTPALKQNRWAVREMFVFLLVC